MDPRTVIPSLEKLLEQGKESALLRYSLGTEYFKLHETWVTIFHLKRAVELDPDYSAAWKLLGLALGEAGILHEALETHRRGIEVATRRGDKQAAKEMGVFASRIEKQLANVKK
jgi:tetratricopeptide (TPR) repeat protein